MSEQLNEPDPIKPVDRRTSLSYMAPPSLADMPLSEGAEVSFHTEDDTETVEQLVFVPFVSGGEGDETPRALATIERVIEVQPIADAHSIERATVRGWHVVTKKDEAPPGSLVIYFEIDTLLNISDSRFAFLAERSVRTDELGNTGHVLKTAKLRGQYSQGLVMPAALFEAELGSITEERIGEDVTAALADLVRLYEEPLPEEMKDMARGMRPGWFPKTVEQRIQNVSSILQAKAQWVPTEKIDGSSTTYWITPDDQGVTTRRVDLKNGDNHYWNLARQMDIFALLRSLNLGERVAFQGEAYGAGMAKNSLKLKDTRWAGFTLRVDGAEIPRGSWPQELLALSVPVHELAVPQTAEQALEQVDGLTSLVSPGRQVEGIVWRAADRTSIVIDGRVERASVKVIANGYAFKNDR